MTILAPVSSDIDLNLKDSDIQMLLANGVEKINCQSVSLTALTQIFCFDFGLVVML